MSKNRVTKFHPPSRFPMALVEEFMGFMAAHDCDQLSDGAWFQMLEDAAKSFCEVRKLGGICPNDLAHFYIRKKCN